ncbi:thioredoxin family protein [Erysipelothrix anatis]|uniref:thioredoxin family protein n=1 Tax=Erysipelothrix anatis TaxID=2683713 RepID=UPI0013592863|nr:thioredoxin family protein [Erysipelothrix anatis]
MIKDIQSNVICDEGKPFTLLQFWAEWCGPCQMMKPIVESISTDEAFNAVSFQRVNVEENNALSDKMMIHGIPALIIMKGSVEVERLVGFRPKPKLVEELNLVIERNV